MITKIAFVGMPTKDLPAAKRFYHELLGLPVTNEYGDHWIEVDTPDGKSIALDPMSPQFKPDATTYLALESDDLEAEVTRLEQAGATVVQPMWINHHPESGQEICRMAIIADPDGNPIMLHQINPDRDAPDDCEH